MHRSLWLEEALGAEGDASPAPPLAGAQRADVAIVGGGFVGLWTALELTRRDPGIEVAIVEQDICGGGASGRNGGFVLSWGAKIEALVGQCGPEEALRLLRMSEDAVDEIGTFCSANGIDAHYVRGGHLWTATTTPTIDSWASTVALGERIGAVGSFVEVDPAEVARLTGSAVHVAGVLEPHGASVQPALLARGLRRVALERGVRIYEQSRVEDIDRGRPPVVRTAHGALVAEKLVVATNAWAANMRELHRRLVALSSEIVATAPIPERLAEIGWTGGECISDSQQQLHYYRTTRDGRIAFGKGGGRLAVAGRVDGPLFQRNPAIAADTAADLRRIYPMLADVPITHDWSGPIDRSPSGLPLLGRLGGRDHVLHGVGWSGNGVGPSLVGGKVLAALVLGASDEWATNALVDNPLAGALPPEPVRYLGGRVVRAAVVRKQRAQEDGRTPDRLTSWVASKAPAGVIPNDG